MASSNGGSDPHTDSVRGNKKQKLDLEEERKFDEYHKKLANIVKTLHSDLRHRVKQSNADIDKAWLDHCNDMPRLKEYSEAMHRLAVDVWEKQRSTRIDWCRDVCLEYFFKPTGLRKVLQKESRRIVYHQRNCIECDSYLSKEHSMKCSSKKSAENIIVDRSISLKNKRCDRNSYEYDSRCAKKYCTENRTENSDEHSIECRKEPSTGDSDEHNAAQSNEHSIECRKEPSTENGEEQATRHVSLSSAMISDTEYCARQANELNDALDSSAKKEDDQVYSDILKDLEASWPLSDGEKIRLLDVGSCYDGFSRYKEFNTVAIDLCPAVKSVLQCDFLRLEVLPLHKILSTDLTPSSSSDVSEQAVGNTVAEFSHHLQTLCSPLVQLAEQSFHVVVFSLLLEYLPSPRQRLLCCDKAWRLLTQYGLLVIITPDSHHASRRSDMMRAWREAIESLGFVRWRYEKQEHLHCMAFRKVLQPGQRSRDVIVSDPVTCAHYNSQHKLPLDDIDENLLYIPQDNRVDTDYCDST